jgi:hypothetical protein
MVGLELGHRLLLSETDPAMDICSSRHSIPSYSMDQLQILNELDCVVWIATYQPGNTQFLWANETALRFWNKSSLDSFTSTDLIAGRSVAVSMNHEEIYNDVQVEYFLRSTVSSPLQIFFLVIINICCASPLQICLKTVRCRRTLYPCGKAMAMDLTFKPIHIVEAESMEHKAQIIVLAVPVCVQVGLTFCISELTLYRTDDDFTLFQHKHVFILFQHKH